MIEFLIWFANPLLVIFITLFAIVILITNKKINFIGLLILLIPLFVSSIILSYIIYDRFVNLPVEIPSTSVHADFNNWKYIQLSDYQKFGNISENCDIMFDPYTIDEYWLHETILVCGGINLQFKHDIMKIMEYQKPLYFITKFFS